jgi:hypothetical protein
MHSRRRLVGAGLAAVAAAALAAALAGTGQTYASLSDYATVTGSAGAGVWAPDPPAACFAKHRKYPGGIVYGTSGPDVLGGGNQGQIIMGLEGDDIIHGNNAKDCLVGGPGDDRIQGGNGKDGIDGGGQQDDICVVEIRKDDFTGCTPVDGSNGHAPAGRDAAPSGLEAHAVTEATQGAPGTRAVDPSQSSSPDDGRQTSPSQPETPTISEPPAVGDGMPAEPTVTPQQQDVEPTPPCPEDTPSADSTTTLVPEGAQPEQATCLATPAP